ncbi:diguanylate cyclase [Kovacikia minuta CCNUW1]|uniref:diguanylate cyclase domain-containing protein n=1 Tax=Kovacikia minuta TaxID=2931930 RepID=UPI001CCE86D5|nr:diguanylate cyclase [Kovacikia minuta]UBF25560.1 diguanylate cyclase [Kovacikia minuta CCNUW1]
MGLPKTMREDILQALVEQICSKLPGCLVTFNGAAFKLKNDFFGHAFVDQEIQAFSNLLQKKCGNNFNRVGGDEWLAFFENFSVQQVQNLLKEFHLEIPINVEWKSHVELNGEIKEMRVTVNATAIRAMRCIYANANNRNEIRSTAIDLLQNNWGLEPNQVLSLCLAKTIQRKRWSCIGNLPQQSPMLPFLQWREI